eukprot:284818909_3
MYKSSSVLLKDSNTTLRGVFVTVLVLSLLIGLVLPGFQLADGSVTRYTRDLLKNWRDHCKGQKKRSRCHVKSLATWIADNQNNVGDVQELSCVRDMCVKKLAISKCVLSGGIVSPVETGQANIWGLYQRYYERIALTCRVVFKPVRTNNLLTRSHRSKRAQTTSAHRFDSGGFKDKQHLFGKTISLLRGINEPKMINKLRFNTVHPPRSLQQRRLIRLGESCQCGRGLLQLRAKLRDTR